MPPSGAPSRKPKSIAELDFGRGVRAIAELVLQPLELQAIGRTVLEQAWHQEATHAVLGLRQHDEGIAHRCRHEPFVAREPIDAVTDLVGGRLVGAHIRAALLFRHAHADGDSGLLHGRLVGRIIFARENLRRPILLDRRRRHHRGDRSAGHGQRAEMAAFQLCRQVKARGANLMRLAFRVRIGLGIPDRGMQARRHGAAHQRMPGRMELDHIQPFTARAVGAQLRHALVRHARQFLRLVRGDVTAHLLEIVSRRARQTGRQIDDQRIGTIGIDAGPEARLVQFGKCVVSPGWLGHGSLVEQEGCKRKLEVSSPNSIAAVAGFGRNCMGNKRA